MSIMDCVVEISGHEKTIGSLEKVVADYKKASINSDGLYKYDDIRHTTAVKAILKISPFYTAHDANQFLGRAVDNLPTAKAAAASSSRAFVSFDGDDDAIRRRLEELKRERDAAINRPAPQTLDASIAWRDIGAQHRPSQLPGAAGLRGVSL